MRSPGSGTETIGDDIGGCRGDGGTVFVRSKDTIIEGWGGGNAPPAEGDGI